MEKSPDLSANNSLQLTDEVGYKEHIFPNKMGSNNNLIFLFLRSISIPAYKQSPKGDPSFTSVLSWRMLVGANSYREPVPAFARNLATPCVHPLDELSWLLRRYKSSGTRLHSTWLHSKYDVHALEFNRVKDEICPFWSDRMDTKESTTIATANYHRLVLRWCPNPPRWAGCQARKKGRRAKNQSLERERNRRRRYFWSNNKNRD